MDATDALGAAYCHFMQMNRPETGVHYSSWKDFVNKNKAKAGGKKTTDTGGTTTAKRKLSPNEQLLAAIQASKKK